MLEPGRILTGSTESIVVRPDRLEIRGLTEAESVDRNAAANFIAGTSFPVSIAVLDAEGDVVPSFAETEEDLSLTHTLVAPADGVPGTLTGGNAASWTESSPGIMTSQVAWNEVGFISLTAQMDSSTYLGVSGLGSEVLSDSMNQVGRFKPASLSIEPSVSGIMLSEDTNCGFVYQTKPNGTTDGQKLFFDSTAYPAIKISGLSSQHTVTHNYAHDDFWALNMNMRATYDNQTSSQATLNPLKNAPSLASPELNRTYAIQGYREYVFDQDTFTYEKAGTTEVYADLPFTPAFTMSIAAVQLSDQDNVMYDTNADGIADAFTGFDAINNGPEVRYGRVVGDHITASGLEPMNITLTAQYWKEQSSIQGFAVNTQHHTNGTCNFPVTVSYYTSTNNLENQGSIAASEVGFTAPTPWVEGMSNFNVVDPTDTTQGPGDDLNGRVPMTINVPDYLQYDFNGDGTYDNPKASATIGKNNSNIIFQRQGYR